MQWVRLATGRRPVHQLRSAQRVCWEGAGHCNRSLFWVRSARPIAFDPIPAGQRGGAGSGRWRPVHLRSARATSPSIETVHYFGFVLPNRLSDMV